MRWSGENRGLGSNKIKEYHMLSPLLWKFVNDINILKELTSPTISPDVGKEPEKAKRTRHFKKINMIICINLRRNPKS